MSGVTAVPFLTAGLHYGIGVFESIRCYETADGAAVFRLRDHVRRLIGSANILGWRDLPYDEEALSSATHETVTANSLRACYIRPLIYLAEGGMNSSLDSGRAHVGIAAWAWKEYRGEGPTTRGSVLMSRHIAAIIRISCPCEPRCPPTM